MSAIVTVPHPVLRQTTKKILKLDKKILDIIQDMTRTLLAAKNPEGVGLAAPQVGLPLQLFLARPDLKKPPLVFINPEILNYSQRLQKPSSKKGVYEGCLSIPHHYSPLSRSMSVTVKYQTIDLNGGQAFQQNRAQPDPGNDQGVGHVFAKAEPQLITKTETFTGFPAHVIQHEMDHLNGILFIDRVLEQNTKLYHVEGDTWEEIVL